MYHTSIVLQSFYLYVFNLFLRPCFFAQKKRFSPTGSCEQMVKSWVASVLKKKSGNLFPTEAELNHSLINVFT